MDIQNLKDPHIAVISDIHGNYVALERCLDHAASNQANAYLFLVDYVSELAYPERTMRLLYETAQKYPCMFIRGNKEDYWFQFRDRGETGWEYGNSTSGALLYAYRSLTSRDFDFFSQMPASRKLLLEGFPGITACHGSPFRVNEKMLPEDENTLQIMERTQTPLILFGHTHVRTRIAGKDRLAINPGSAGISYRSGGKAQYLLLHGRNGGWEEEPVSLPYDTDRVIRELHESGLYRHAPYWCVVTENILRGGELSHGTVLARVMELCTQDTGSCSWPDIPEKYWEKVIAELKLGNEGKRRQKDGRSKGGKDFYVPGQSAGGNDSGYPEAERDTGLQEGCR